MMKNKSLLYALITIVAVIAINAVAGQFYKRFDLTKDQRYTFSEATEILISKIDSPLIIDVFLEGNLTSEFRLLQTEVKQIIEELQLKNNGVFVNYINPLENEDERQRNINQLTNAGLKPYINTNANTGKVTTEIIFPWAFASFRSNTVKIPLLKNSITQGLSQQINNSVQALEYTFADGIRKLTTSKTKAIAVLKGNGQLNDIYIADFLKTIKPYYNIAPFTLDSVASNAQNTLDKLKTFDLIIAAKPTEAFSENEKLVLDQYTMSGGKSLWLTEAVIIDKDSLYNEKGSSVSFIRNLNLNDFFFQYGIRINPSLVKDLFSAPITLAIGEGSEAQLQPIQWQYSPLAASNNNHSITKNIDLVKFDFASPIDTLKNTIQKTILLQSSPRTKIEGAPKLISLSEITKTPDEASYNDIPQPMAVLLEGKFKSVYDNRVLPFKVNNYLSKGKPTKIVIISDGDLIKNEVLKTNLNL